MRTRKVEPTRKDHPSTKYQSPRKQWSEASWETHESANRQVLGPGRSCFSSRRKSELLKRRHQHGGQKQRPSDRHNSKISMPLTRWPADPPPYTAEEKKWQRPPGRILAPLQPSPAGVGRLGEPPPPPHPSIKPPSYPSSSKRSHGQAFPGQGQGRRKKRR